MHKRDGKPVAQEPSGHINVLEFLAYKQIIISTCIILLLLRT